MSKIYTPNDFIRFIYQETSQAEASNIQHLVSHNVKAKEELDSLREILGMLDEVALDAHPTSIQLVLEHAHRLAEEVI
jgi:hypothetical protein